MTTEDILHARKCRCGWLLPFSVMPRYARSEELITGAFVTLYCPVCKAFHGFYNSEDPELMRMAQAKNLKAMKDIQ